MSKLSKKSLNRNYIKSSKLMRGGISECENYKSEYDKYNKIYTEEKKKIRDLTSNIDEIETLMDNYDVGDSDYARAIEQRLKEKNT